MHLLSEVRNLPVKYIIYDEVITIKQRNGLDLPRFEIDYTSIFDLKLTTSNIFLNIPFPSKVSPCLDKN